MFVILGLPQDSVNVRQILYCWAAFTPYLKKIETCCSKLPKLALNQCVAQPGLELDTSGLIFPDHGPGSPGLIS